VGPSKISAASPAAGVAVGTPGGDCAFDYAGNHLVDDDIIIPGYTVTCWDAEWNL